MLETASATTNTSNNDDTKKTNKGQVTDKEETLTKQAQVDGCNDSDSETDCDTEVEEIFKQDTSYCVDEVVFDCLGDGDDVIDMSPITYQLDGVGDDEKGNNAQQMPGSLTVFFFCSAVKKAFRSIRKC